MSQQKAKGGEDREFDFLLEEGERIGALEAKIIGLKGEGTYVIHD
jgi:hypothetical protein